MNDSMLEQKLPINNDVKNMISNIGSGIPIIWSFLQYGVFYAA